jgi:hypothetical protein
MNFSAIDWPATLLVGSIGLLVWALALRVYMKPEAPARPPDRDSIERYRPQSHH